MSTSRLPLRPRLMENLVIALQVIFFLVTRFGNDIFLTLDAKPFVLALAAVGTDATHGRRLRFHLRAGGCTSSNPAAWAIDSGNFSLPLMTRQRNE